MIGWGYAGGCWWAYIGLLAEVLACCVAIIALAFFSDGPPTLPALSALAAVWRLPLSAVAVAIEEEEPEHN
jgi:hypothetical protein